MKLFRTVVSPKKAKRSLTLKNRVFTIGSCFAEAMGMRLKNFKFFSCVNPFGTVYNPVSIHTLLKQSMDNERVAEHTYVENNGLHFNYNFHSQLSSPGRKELEVLLEETVRVAQTALADIDTVLITYGTAWVYERNDTKEVVANCHKVPQHNFTKRLLTEEEINASFEHFYRNLKAVNPKARIILTISPVRHIKDTLELNSISKSILRKICYDLTEKYEDVDYFPAYEIMIDDLRDYRFYKSDMLHPTEEAEDYIWENFLESYFDDEAKSFVTHWTSIVSALNHKPFHPNSETHQKFLRDTLKRIQQFAAIVDVSAEIKGIQEQLTIKETTG